MKKNDYLYLLQRIAINRIEKNLVILFINYNKYYNYVNDDLAPASSNCFFASSAVSFATLS